MARQKNKGSARELSHQEGCDLLEEVLRGDTRAEILSQLLREGSFPAALRALRNGMRAHGFRTAAGRLDLAGPVAQLDRRTREDGFYVLHAWDPAAHRFSAEIIPVLMLDYVTGSGAPITSPRAALAVLLDCYLLYLVALLAMRARSEDDPNAALDRVTRLIGDLQGPGGSGRRFVETAEMLLLLAISQYQPEEAAYDRLLAELWELDEAHRLSFALAGAPNLSSHLRWGFHAMYRRDPERMRADNVVDYPWLLFSLVILMREYERLRDAGVAAAGRVRVVEGLLNGLAGDPDAFLGEAPDSLSGHRAEHAYLRGALLRHRADLLREGEAQRPSGKAYSPLGLHFNFMHNALVAIVALGMTPGTAPNLAFDALFRAGEPGGALAESPEVLARLMMGFSGSEPARASARGSVLVVYDPKAGLESFNAVMEALSAAEPAASGAG